MISSPHAAEFARASFGAPPLSPRPTSNVFALTPAETRVLTFLLDGLSNKEIASAVGRSEATVKNQVASILRKYRVPSRTRLLALSQHRTRSV